MAHHVSRTLAQQLVKEQVSSPLISGAKSIYNRLCHHNVKEAFIYSGGNVMPLIDQFSEGKINYTISANEQVGCHSATGYAKATGKPGIFVATSGPGITNCITPMIDAQHDSTPLIVFSGNVKKSVKDTVAFQEAPALEMTEKFTKWSYYCQDGSDIENIVDKAFRIATEGKPGVVHIDVPTCILSNMVFIDSDDDVVKKDAYCFDSKINPVDSLISTRNSLDNLDILCETLTICKNPVLFIGQGCSKEYKLVRTLVDQIGIPATTTVHAMGIIDERHCPYALEMCGMHGSVAANHALQKADCIIGIGTRFDDRTVGNFDKYAPGAIQAHSKGLGGIFSCNIKTDDIKTISPHYHIELDSNQVLQKLIQFTKASNIDYKDKWKHWNTQIQDWKKTHPFVYTPSETKDGLKTQTVLDHLSKYVDENTIITTGVGNHQMMASQFIKWNHPRQMITSGSMGVMGTSLPYAIGAQLAFNGKKGVPHKTVICLDGDGSFNMSLHDLKTIAEYDIPVKIFILNDNCLSMVRAWEKLYYDGRYVATTLRGNPNYRRVARAYGIPSLRCEKKSLLDDNIEMALQQKGPVLVEFTVESDVCFPLVGPGKALDDMLTHT